MRRFLGILTLYVLVATGSAWAQADLFARVTKWNVVESWNQDKLVYTFAPNNTFQSSKESGGKGRGTWVRDGRSFAMVWPHYDGAIYVGTIGDREIRGSGFTKTGKSFGTFVFRLIP